MVKSPGRLVDGIIFPEKAGIMPIQTAIFLAKPPATPATQPGTSLDLNGIHPLGKFPREQELSQSTFLR